MKIFTKLRSEFSPLFLGDKFIMLNMKFVAGREVESK